MASRTLTAPEIVYCALRDVMLHRFELEELFDIDERSRSLVDAVVDHPGYELWGVHDEFSRAIWGLFYATSFLVDAIVRLAEIPLPVSGEDGPIDALICCLQHAAETLRANDAWEKR